MALEGTAGENNYVEILPLVDIMYTNVQIQQSECMAVMHSDCINDRSTEVLIAKDKKLLFFPGYDLFKFVDLPI